MRADHSPARLLIADDHDLVREGLSMMFSREEDLEVVGEAADGRQAVEMCHELRPDLVLMDVRMPVMDGLSATRTIKAENPEVGVLVITTHADPEYLLNAVEAGAAGYVLKDASRHELVGAVRKVLAGESALHQDLAMSLLRRLANRDADGTAPRLPASEERPDPPLEPLTPREIEILALVSDGLTNREIAERLRVSTGTVKNHVQRIIAKMGVSDRTQAAVRALVLGIIPGQETAPA